MSATIPLADAALARHKYSAIAVYTPDPAIYPYVAKRAREGFPIVTWHRLPEQGSVPGLTAAVGHDVAQAASDAALAMGKVLDGKGTIAVTQGSFNAEENQMAADFAAVIAKNFPTIQLLAPQLEGFEPSAAKAKAIALLQGNPAITGAFSTTGNGAETWSGAARTAHRRISIISMDYTRQNLDLVKSGEVYAIVAQPLYEEGAAVADLAGQLAAQRANAVPQCVAGQGRHRRRAARVLQDSRGRRPVGAAITKCLAPRPSHLRSKSAMCPRASAASKHCGMSASKCVAARLTRSSARTGPASRH